MKQLTLILILTAFYFGAWAQCPIGFITLSTQPQIDNFAANYPGCTELPNGLAIEQGGSSASDIITNLNGLSQLTYVGGLSLRSNFALNNLSGLNNLTSIGGNFYVRFNDNLQNFQGLNNVTSIDGYMLVQWNASLSSVNGLNNLTSIGGNMDFYQNNVFSSFAAFSNLTTVNGNIEIENNNSLQSLNGLDNIDYQGVTLLRIGSNPNLSVCGVTSICNYLENGGVTSIYDNASGCASEIEIINTCPMCSYPAIISVDDQPIPDGIYQAGDEVNAIGTVPVGGNVNFKAGQIIMLDDGFIVEPNADFSAEIEDCTGQ